MTEAQLDKSHYVFAAQPGTEAFELLSISELDNGKWDVGIQRHSVVGWEASGTWAEPLCPYGVPVRAVQTADGTISDLILRTCFPSYELWEAAVGEAEGGEPELPLNPTTKGVPLADVQTVGAAAEVMPRIDMLGWSGRAVAPLTRMGITHLDGLSDFIRSDIRDTKGVSAKELWIIESDMIRAGVPWSNGMPVWKDGKHVGDKPRHADDDEDDLDDLV